MAKRKKTRRQSGRGCDKKRSTGCPKNYVLGQNRAYCYPCEAGKPVGVDYKYRGEKKRTPAKAKQSKKKKKTKINQFFTTKGSGMKRRKINRKIRK